MSTSTTAAALSALAAIMSLRIGDLPILSDRLGTSGTWAVLSIFAAGCSVAGFRAAGPARLPLAVCVVAGLAVPIVLLIAHPSAGDEHEYMPFVVALLLTGILFLASVAALLISIVGSMDRESREGR